MYLLGELEKVQLFHHCFITTSHCADSHPYPTPLPHTPPPHYLKNSQIVDLVVIRMSRIKESAHTHTHTRTRTHTHTQSYNIQHTNIHR